MPHQMLLVLSLGFACMALGGCSYVHSDPNTEVAGWWYNTVPEESGYGDDVSECQKYGRCTGTKGPGGGSRVSASRASERSSSSSSAGRR